MSKAAAAVKQKKVTTLDHRSHFVRASHGVNNLDHHSTFYRSTVLFLVISDSNQDKQEWKAFHKKHEKIFTCHVSYIFSNLALFLFLIFWENFSFVS